MTMLKYKTRDNRSPQGLPHVYYCAHEKDYDTYFEVISKKLLEKQNCAVWYLEDPSVSWNEELEEHLAQMQLFVIPVTSKFLFEDNRARLQEFAFAMEHHIPVLPLQQEDGLEPYFNQRCADLQLLYDNPQDVTALSYEDKLEKFLSSVLVGDELAEKIRRAFDAYVFLSYRKKDRRYAQELMKLIHQNDFCRDIAIWYDEFLVPGENFNQAIKDAMEKSRLFVLAVTPNLVNEPNYIRSVEYPEAATSGKPIVPAQMEETDGEELSKQYLEIPPCVDPRDDEEFAKALQKAVGDIGLRENDNEPSHNFFIGLAYLSGIDVEVNYDRAKAMIEGAANAGFLPAAKKMVEMYLYGKGVPRNQEKVTYWQEKVVDLCRKEYETSSDMEHAWTLGYELSVLVDCWNALGQLFRAEKAAEEFHELCQKVAGEQNIYWKQMTMTACLNMAKILCNKGKTEEALIWAERGREFGESLCEEDKDKPRQVYLNLIYRTMFDIHYHLKGHAKEAFEWGAKWMELWEKEVENMPSGESRSQLVQAYMNVGWLETACRHLDDAMKHFQKALAIVEEFAKESGKEKDRLATVYLGMTYASGEQGKTEEAIEYCLKSASLQEEYAKEYDTIQSKTLFVSVSMFLSNLYEKQGEYRKAIEWLEKQLRMTEHLAVKTDIPANRYRNIFNMYRVGEMYFNIKDYENAKNWYERALAENEAWMEEGETSDKWRLSGTISYHLQKLYEALGQSDLAKEWSRKSTDAHLNARIVK